MRFMLQDGAYAIRPYTGGFKTRPYKRIKSWQIH